MIDRRNAHPVLTKARRLVFAHRGGAELRPENTLEAFDHGLALGSDGLELDVQLSRDGQVVVMHDTTLDRTTDGRGAVAAFTSSELQALDAGYSFEPAAGFPFRGRRIRVPLLRDVLQRYPAVPLIIELKGSDVALSAAAVDEVRAAGALDRACFGSFNDRVLRFARGRGRDVVTGAGARETLWAMWASRVALAPLWPRFHAFQVPEEHQGRPVATPRFIRTVSRGGLVVQVWTPNDGPTMVRLLRAGVQAIITDRPDIGVPVVREFNARHG